VKVFVGFGYNDRDAWIKRLVFPIVEAFGHSVETGEDLVGQPIEQGVAERIDRSHAAIGFLTRRDPTAGGGWTTHRWVTDELARADAKGLLIIEVREDGVDPQGGIVGNRQRLQLDDARREEFLVALVGALGKWPRGTVKLQLIGDDVDQLVPLLRQPGFSCLYRFNVGGNESDPIAAVVRPIVGGLFIEVENPPPQGLIQVEVSYRNRLWSSNFESMESHNIRLIGGRVQ
jgi:hypothetical protein